VTDARYLDRDLSWLQFNRRVLELAERPSMPVLDRLKFVAIAASNLEEFFSVRVAGAERKIRDGESTAGLASLDPRDLVRRIRRQVVAQEARLQGTLADEIAPQLARAGGPRILPVASLRPEQRHEVEQLFWHEVVPVLSPTPFETTWSFPPIPSMALGIVAHLRSRGRERYAFVRVPRLTTSRFVQLADRRTFVPLEQVVHAHLRELFPSWRVLDSVQLRIVRDMDVDLDARGEAGESPRRWVERGLRGRGDGPVVRVQVQARSLLPTTWQQLRRVLGVQRRHVYFARHMLALDGLMQVATVPGHDGLRLPPITPVPHPRLAAANDAADVFDEIARRDVLVQHPYDDYASTVERFERACVEDTDVLAIKHTLYRTSDDSSLVPALIAAQDRERRAVCLVELKARFDELSNIQLARELEHAGVQVSYGDSQLKAHAKAILVVRREGQTVRRYAHIGTGNYHARTARLYEDVGLLTADPQIADDVARLFLWTTDGAPRPAFERLLVAPGELRDGIVERIRKVAASARRGERAVIRFKSNGLADRRIAEELYVASQAGAQIDLVVRGVCCLRPGVPGMSERIRVVSIIGRVLEHSRVYCFEAGPDVEVYVGSADMMERNLDRRIEVLAPVDDPVEQTRLLSMLARYMAERRTAWLLDGSGRWRKAMVGADAPQDIHVDLAATARASAGASDVGGIEVA
jgi:polyphosphate kinase